MKKLHAGSGRPQGSLHKGGLKPPKNPTHAGSGRSQGVTQGPPQPRQYGLHGGSNLRQGTLKGRK
jgi:hypothetical protein